MIALTLFFTIGSIFSINIIYQYNNQSKVHPSPIAHADWPELDINELINDADVIAIVQSTKQEFKEEPIDDGHFLERQYSDLDIKKVLKGNPDTEIVLNQAIDYIKKNEKYLVFLRKGEDGYYYELTDDAIVPYEEGKYISEIKDFTDEFKEEELINEINKQMVDL